MVAVIVVVPSLDNGGSSDDGQVVGLCERVGLKSIKACVDFGFIGFFGYNQ